MKRESEIHKINTDEETIDNLEEINLKNIRLFKGFTFARNPNDRLPSKFLLRSHLWLREIQLHWKEALVDLEKLKSQLNFERADF